MASNQEQSFSIRPATAADLDDLAEIWYDRAALLSQMGLVRLLPDAQARWLHAARAWLSDPNILFWLALSDGKPRAALVATVMENRPGLAPDRVAHVLDLIVDLHAPEEQRSAARYLFQAIRDLLKAQRIEQIYAEAITQAPVEQAFWLAVGGKRVLDIFRVAT